MSHCEKHRCLDGEHQNKKGFSTRKIIEEAKVETTLKWVETQILGPDMEKSTSSKLTKESDKGPYCHSAYVNQMQSILLKYQVTESEAATRLFGETSTTSDM